MSGIRGLFEAPLTSIDSSKVDKSLVLSVHCSIALGYQDFYRLPMQRFEQISPLGTS